MGGSGVEETGPGVQHLPLVAVGIGEGAGVHAGHLHPVVVPAPAGRERAVGQVVDGLRALRGDRDTPVAAAASQIGLSVKPPKKPWVSSITQISSVTSIPQAFSSRVRSSALNPSAS